MGDSARAEATTIELRNKITRQVWRLAFADRTMLVVHPENSFRRVATLERNRTSGLTASPMSIFLNVGVASGKPPALGDMRFASEELIRLR